MKLQDIKVSTKLLATNLAVVLSFCSAAAWLEHSVTSTLNEANARVIDISGTVSMSRNWKGKSDANVQRVIAAAFATTPEIRAGMLQRVAQNNSEISVVQEQLKTRAKRTGDDEALSKIASARVRVHVDMDEINRLEKANEQHDLEQYVESHLYLSLSSYMAALDDFIKLQESHLVDDKAAAAKAQVTAEWTGFGVMVVVALASLAWMLLVARSIVGPLQRAVHVADAIAAGDLTQSIAANGRKDEIGALESALAAMGAKLRQVVAEVRQGVDSVSTASTEIAAGNADLSSRTEQAAANLEEAAASMEQLTGTVAHTAEVSVQASMLATSAVDAAVRGREVVGDVVTRMSEISESSARITDIISVIDGIAFQTNILALNAAVEAARAGEQGRGFAVVASEVRNLAQRSAAAAKEIKALIAASTEKVDAGAVLVGKTGEVMADIEASIKRATDLMSEISSAATEQRDGIAQVNQSVNHLDEMTQQNAALVEESVAAATAMRTQAATLASLVATFKVDDGAVAHAVVPVHAPARRITPVSAPKAESRGPAAKRTRVEPTALTAGDWEEF